MKRVLIFVVTSLLAIAAISSSCVKQHENGEITLKWTGGPSLSESIFYLDEINCGSGGEGLRRLIKALEVVPDHSSITIDYPPDMLAYSEDRYSYFYYMPLTDQDQDLKHWEEFMTRKGFTVTIRFDPGG